MSEALSLELRSVSATYGPVQALSGVTMRLRAGLTTAIIGANGAGKTTSLNVMAGLHRVAEGTVLVGGAEQPIRRTAVIRPGIGYSPEGRRVFTQMTVEENLLIGAHCDRRRRDVEARLHRVFDRLPLLHERRFQAAGTLSGGQQQMLAIGRALMRDPEVLLLDEPTLGLSPKMVWEVAGLIRSIGAEGITIALVEQNARVALSLAQHAYILESGKVTMSGPAEEMRNDPRIRESYLSKSGG